MPGTWYAQDDNIHVQNPDGTWSTYQTNWSQWRRDLEEQERRAKKEAIVLHLQEKRIKEPKKKTGRGT